MVRFSLLFLIFIVLISYGQSVNFALWQDDNALIFKLQHLDEQAGVFGPGPFGLGAYRYIAVPYIPLYKLFGMNIGVFYAWAIGFYFLASISIFFLSRELTKNNLLAFLSGAIFAAGFIGSDGILRLFNSIQTSYSVIFTAILFIFLQRFVKTGGSIYYFLGLFSFLISLETAFIRTQYLIFPLIFFFLLFRDWKKSGNFLKNLFLILPFLFVYHYIFSRSVDARVNLVKDYVEGIFSGKLEYTHSFFGSLGNVTVPQPITRFLFDLAAGLSLDYTNRLVFLELGVLVISVFLINFILRNTSKLVRILFSLLVVVWFIFGMVYFHGSEVIFSHSLEYDIVGIFANFIGGLFLIFLTGIIITLWIKNQENGKLLIFLSVWCLANILAYSVYLPFLPLESINRYLVHSLAAYAILMPIALFYILKRLGIAISVLLIFANIYFSINYQNTFIREKSIATKSFYDQLSNYVPEIKEGSVMYFDIADDEVSKQEFRDFFSVGSMPDSTAIAIRYGIDRDDVKMTNNFAEFFSYVRDLPEDLIFSFFYSKGELKNTTSITRLNLREPRVVEYQEQNLFLITPVLFQFRARATPKISIQSCIKQDPIQKEMFLNYLLSRDDFRRKVKVSTSSEERYQTSKFLLDGDYSTLFRGSRGFWHNSEREEIIVDLGVNKNIGQIVWVNGYANSTPIDYKVEVSLDGKAWKRVKEVINNRRLANGDVIVDDFASQLVRFVKFAIEGTFDNDSPAIGEIEVVEKRFMDLDKEKINEFETKSLCAANIEEANLLENFIARRGIEAIISWRTDKSIDNKVRTILIPDNSYHTYEILLTPGGTSFAKLELEYRLIQADVNLTDMRIIYPNKEKLSNLLDLQVQ